MIDYEAIKIGKVFEMLRRQRLMTQEDLAEYSDRDRRTISDIENDKYKPGFEIFVNLAYAFNMLPSELFLEIEKKSNFLEYYNQNKQSDEQE